MRWRSSSRTPSSLIGPPRSQRSRPDWQRSAPPARRSHHQKRTTNRPESKPTEPTNPEALRDDAQISRAALQSLEAALREERAGKEALAAELQRLHDGGAVEVTDIDMTEPPEPATPNATNPERKALQYLENQDWGTASKLALSRGISPRQPASSPFASKMMASPLPKLALGAPGEAGEEGFHHAKSLVAELAELRQELERGALEDVALGKAVRSVALGR